MVSFWDVIISSSYGLLWSDISESLWFWNKKVGDQKKWWFHHTHGGFSNSPTFNLDVRNVKVGGSFIRSMGTPVGPL